MPKMTLMWVALYAAGTLGSFIHPLLGVLTYLFEYYLRPSLHWWGKELPDLRYNFAIATVATVTFLIRRGSLPAIVPARRAPAACLLALALLMFVSTNTVAVNPTLSQEKTIGYLKLILFHGLIVGTVRTPVAFDAVVGMHLAGAGWWGWEAFQDPKREAGRLANVGSGDSQGDNAAAAHLLTVVPFLAVYGLFSRDKRLKYLAIATAPFVLNAIVLCNSRGGVLGLIAAGVAGLWFARSGHRLRAAGAGILGALAVLYLADPEFMRRQQFNENYVDGSAQQRLVSIDGGLALIQDYPMGAGGGGFYELSPTYIPGVVRSQGEKRDPHNTLVLVGSDWGLVGLALYLGYYFTCYLLLREVRRRAPEGGLWYYRSVAVQLAMIGIFVAGLFTDRLYAEAPYWMGALAVALHRIQSQLLATSTVAASDGREQPGTVRPERPAARVFTPSPATSAAAH